MSLDDLERKLYDRKKKEKGESYEEVKKKSDINQSSYGFLKIKEKKEYKNLPIMTSKNKKKIKWLPWILTGLGLVVVAWSIYSWLPLWSQGGVVVELELPEEAVAVGNIFTARVKVDNQSSYSLENANITLSLPEVVIFAETAPEKRLESKEVGTIGVGSFAKKEFELAVVGEANSVKEIEAAILYETDAFGSKFENKNKQELLVGEPVIWLNLEIPKKIFSGEEFESILTYRNNTEEVWPEVEMSLDYPDNFTITEIAGDMAWEGGKTWQINNLPAKEEKVVKIKGIINGPADSFFDFKTGVNIKIAGETYTINEVVAGFAIKPSPLSLKILINDREEVIAQPGNVLRYSLLYENNTTATLKDVVISTKLEGEMFDLSSIQSEGFFNSRTGVLTWNAGQKRELVSVAPGVSGLVSFSVNVKNDYPISQLSDKDFTLRMEAVIESPTVPKDFGAFKTIGLASNEIKVAGKVEINAKGIFRDAALGVVNSGPWPPKINQTTQFTIHWQIKTYATDLSNLKVTAWLSPGVSFVDNVYANRSSLPTYNERTQEVVWQLSKLTAGTGILTDPAEAVFQIEVAPSILSLGNFVDLLGVTRITAEDDFTGLDLSSSDGEVSTKLPDDSTVAGNEGKVIE